MLDHRALYHLLYDVDSAQKYKLYIIIYKVGCLFGEKEQNQYIGDMYILTSIRGGRMLSAMGRNCSS